MPITFRHTGTGQECTVPGPSDEPVRRVRPRAQRIARFDASPEWERVEAAPAPTGPKPADVRAWARDQGIDVPVRGKLPVELVSRYVDAHTDE
jgi:hypothetical protein